ncbi:hypothetical protein [Nocardia jiangxiensis]|uniref:hypothetical protein n=1 Tax=Nocardia jiangxiensis TaxID=282685 RepID=UPI0002F529C4|nr:hypothetical protein [Nocardia jiangxiensis]
MPELVISGKSKEALEIAHRKETTGVRFPAPVGRSTGRGFAWTYTLPEPLYRELVYRMHRIYDRRFDFPDLPNKHAQALRTDLAKIDGVDKIVKDVEYAWRHAGRMYIDYLKRASADVDPDAEPVIEPPRPDKNNITIWCKCKPSRPVRIAAGRFTEGGITCDICGCAFEPKS